eukprot:454431-Pyramimonas_sp.AAC.1
MEGWFDIFFMTWDTWSVYGIVFWVAVVMFCGYFLVSLATAVVYVNFSTAVDEDVECAPRPIASTPPIASTRYSTNLTIASIPL